MNCQEGRDLKEKKINLTIGQIVRKPTYWLTSLTATFFIIIFLFFAGKFLAIFDFLDPIGDALAGYEITDQVFSNPQWREIPPAEENIVIVNVGNLSRAEIGRQINIINSFNPKVIGLDLIFRNLKPDTLGDMILADALANSPNIILYQKLLAPDNDFLWHDAEYSHPIFTQNHRTAFVNLINETPGARQFDFKSCRSFFPKQYLYDSITHQIDTVYAFSVVLANYISPKNVKLLLNRNNEEEVINYSGNIVDYGRTRLGTRFFALDAYDVFDTATFTPDLLKDKIVLMGVMGSSFNDKYTVEDKYFTPLNSVQAGRANPDMYGVVVHANIISMILNKSYIDNMSKYTSYIVAFLLCFFNVLIFTIIYYKYSEWYDGVTKLLQLIQALIFVFIIILFFHWFSYKLDLTLTIILVLLTGDVLEVFYGFIVNIYCKIKIKKK